MAAYTAQYPVTPEVRAALARYPNIAQRLKLGSVRASPAEIVRVLGNTHYPHLAVLLRFMDGALRPAGDVGKRLLQQTDPISFEQELAALFLLVHLQGHLGTRAKAVPLSSRTRRHDIDVDLGGEGAARIEVYAPFDFAGLQRLETEVVPLFKYLDVGVGFTVDLDLETIQPFDVGYAYAIGDQPPIREWLRGVQKGAAVWLSSEAPELVRLWDVPEGSVRLRASIREVHADRDVRLVTFSAATRSTDARLFFEVGTVEETVRSQWGRKLKDKLGKRQAGDPAKGVLRLLVVDFRHADTGWPDFICWPEIHLRMTQAVQAIATDLGPPIPYDVIAPALLSQESCFAPPIWLVADRTDHQQAILDALGLSRPCVPRKETPIDWADVIEPEAV